LIGHTDAFAQYRQLSQAHLNFVVAVAHAMPALRADIALPAPTLTYPPDHFLACRNPKSEVATYVAGCQEELARSTVIAVFSYFEGYARSVFREIVAYHGGGKKLRELAHDRISKFISAPGPGIMFHKRKLQDKRAPSKLFKYQKHGRLLDEKGFKFPTDLLAHFGVVQLLARIENDHAFRAWQIPSLFEECLLFPLTSTDRQLYEEVIGLRNDVAHGKAPTVTLPTSLRYASELHTLASKVDRHIAEHFLVIQIA
jgi:hypothetical protein